MTNGRMTSVEQLRFLVGFAKMDLSKDRRPGDWMNLQDDIYKFLSGGEGFLLFDPSKNPEAKHYPQKNIIALQKELRGLLPLAPQDWDLALGPMVENLKVGPLTYDGFKIGGLVGRGSVRDMFLQATIHLLTDADTVSKVRKCPSCDAIFIRVKRQIYCSGPCVDKANKAAWLETPKGKKYLRKLKQKRKKKHGNS